MFITIYKSWSVFYVLSPFFVVGSKGVRSPRPIPLCPLIFCLLCPINPDGSGMRKQQQRQRIRQLFVKERVTSEHRATPASTREVLQERHDQRKCRTFHLILLHPIDFLPHSVAFDRRSRILPPSVFPGNRSPLVPSDRRRFARVHWLTISG